MEKKSLVKRSKILVAGLLLAINIFMGVTLAITNHLADATLFLFFGAGMYWYIRLLRTQKQIPWYELADIEGGEL